MLGKMLVHGLAAALLIGSAAAVYAQTRDNGALATPAPAPTLAAPAVTPGGDGYIRPSPESYRKDRREHDGKGERRRHDGRERGHDHDDD